MTDSGQLALSSADLKIILDVLRQYVPERDVRAFGSRVAGMARPYSDLDLVIMGTEPLPLGRLAAIKEAFAESDLPFKVDMVLWGAVHPQFQAVIAENWVILQKGMACG